jgi:hypothetical protein
MIGATLMVACCSIPDLAAQAEALTSPWHERAARRANSREKSVTDAVDRGIGWLKSHQEEGGWWSADKFMLLDPADDRCSGAGNKSFEIGLTGLSLLAILAQGDPLHNDSCNSAADWLAKQFDQKTGKINVPTHDFIYSHAIVTLALLEAWQALRVQRFKKTAQLGVRYMMSHRNLGGAWRYLPQSGGNDSSVTAWCMAVIHAAYESGLEADAVAAGQAISWLDSVTNSESGHTGYTERDQVSARTINMVGLFPPKYGDALTAAGLHTRLLTGLHPKSEFAMRAATRILERPPFWGSQHQDFYYWLQGSMAMALMGDTSTSKSWRTALHKALLPTQITRGSARGSWDPVGPWAKGAGRIFSTASAVISLASPYRSKPLGPLGRVHKLRGVTKRLEDAKFGAAAALLRKVEPSTPEETEYVAFLKWSIKVEEARAAASIAALEKRYPAVLRRQQELERMATSYAGLAVSAAINDALDHLHDDPYMKAELAADRSLQRMKKAYEKALKSNKSSTRRRMAIKLRTLAEKHPDTLACTTALQWAETLK